MSEGSCRVCGTRLPPQKAGQRRLYCPESSKNCRRKAEFAHRDLPKMAFHRDELRRRAREIEAAYEAARRGHRSRPYLAGTPDGLRAEAAEVEARMVELARSVGLPWPPERAAARLAS
jgi:hypothetical protein